MSPTQDRTPSLPVLVTGAAGFIGAALCDALLARGHRVVALDTGDPEERLGNTERPGLEFVRGDVRDKALVAGLVARCSRVAHLAAIVGVDDYIQRPDQVFDVNVEGARAVFEACLEHRRPVLFSSTSEAYGRNSGLLGEDASTVLGPSSRSRWVYAVSKLAGEHLAFALGRAGLCFSIVRYFNVYGPLMDGPGRGRVLAKFVGALRDGEPLTLVDGGEAVRSFCWVDDAVEATARLLTGLSPDASFAGEVVNIGRREPVSMRTLAELVVELSGHPHGTVDVPGEKFFGPGFEEIPLRVPDVERLRLRTGYEAPTPLREGVRRLLSHWNLLGASSPEAPPARTVPFVRPRFVTGDALLRRLGALLDSGKVTNDGPVLARFEREVARWLGVEEVVGVGSGAAALMIAVRALGLTGGRVVLPSFTYNATLSAFVLNGLEPVFCDIDPDTFTLSPDALEAVLARTEGVTAVAPVTVYGVPPALDRIVALARSAGARVVHDDSHGLGSELSGRRVPEGPDVTTFSLHATKTLPAVEGGLVYSADPDVLAASRRLRAHGLDRAHPLRSTAGWNARLDELRATIAEASLSELDAALSTRRRAAERLEAAALDCGGFWQLQQRADAVSSRQNLAVLAAKLPPGGIDELISAFAGEGVEVRRYFDPPLHRLDEWAGRAALPVTDDVWSRLVCLPLHTAMDERDLDAVARALGVVARRYGR